MKRKFYLKTLILAAAVSSAMLSYTAFADAETNAPLISANPEQDDASEAPAIEEGFTAKSGIISSIESDSEGSVRIAVGGMEDGIVLIVPETLIVVDSSDGSVKTVKDLKEGDDISAFLPAASPMTMSLPPISSSARAIVINSEGGNSFAGKFNDELVDAGNTLKLNIAEDTNIIHENGAKMIFKAEDIVNNEALVIYGASTRSIPAQTTPELVVILSADEETDADAEAPDAEAPETETPDAPPASEDILPTPDSSQTTPSPEFIGLRETAERLGYTLVWTANDKPVELKKANLTVVINLGSSSCTVNGVSKALAEAVRLDGDKMVVSNDILNILN